MPVLTFRHAEITTFGQHTQAGYELEVLQLRLWY